MRVLRQLMKRTFYRLCPPARRLRNRRDELNAKMDLCRKETEQLSKDNNIRYSLWRDSHQLQTADRIAMWRQSTVMFDPPRISVLMRIEDALPGAVQATVESVLQQAYPHLELCIVVATSASADVVAALEGYCRLDKRIEMIRGEGAEDAADDLNAGLALVSGSFVALLDPGDLLAEHALFRVAQAVIGDPAIDMIYSDEDRIDADERHCDPRYKPGWSPEYLLACMYTGRLGAYRISVVREIGGFRKGFGDVAEYDLVLRLTSCTSNIRHIAEVLYHRQDNSDPMADCLVDRTRSIEAGRRAIEDRLCNSEQQAIVSSIAEQPFLYRVRYAIQKRPKVSIIIPSACRRRANEDGPGWYLAECLKSVYGRSTYRNFEVIVVDNGDAEPDLERALAPYGVRRRTYSGPINLAIKMNLGADCAEGEHLIFMNDDTEVITPDWIESLLEFSQCAEIGAVGPKLFFTNGNLQHVGVVFPDQRFASHCFYNFPGDFPGRPNATLVHCNYMAVTGACFMTRRDVFESVHGYDERFAISCNDADYCFRVFESGKRVVFQPHAHLYHHEAVSRPKRLRVHEFELMERLWAKRLPRDPYFNPNLTISDNDSLVDPDAARPGFSLRPPRARVA